MSEPKPEVVTRALVQDVQLPADGGTLALLDRAVTLGEAAAGGGGGALVCAATGLAPSSISATRTLWHLGDMGDILTTGES